MGIQGSLHELPLTEALQLVTVTGKSGSFTLSNGSESGEVFLSEGKIVSARLGRLEGEEALYQMALWGEGFFRFTPGEPSAPVNIRTNNTGLLMEAAARREEWKVLRKRVPDTGLVPVFTEHGVDAVVSLSPAEWKVVRKIDGRSSVEEIASELGLSGFETAKTVYGLIANGVVTLSEAPSRPGGRPVLLE